MIGSNYQDNLEFPVIPRNHFIIFIEPPQVVTASTKFLAATLIKSYYYIKFGPGALLQNKSLILNLEYSRMSLMFLSFLIGLFLRNDIKEQVGTYLGTLVV